MDSIPSRYNPDRRDSAITSTEESAMIHSEDFYGALSQGKVEDVKALTQKALETGESPDAVLKNGLLLAMEKIGVLFKNNEIYIPEVLIAAKGMHACLAILKPILSKSTTRQPEKILVGTVKGDLHDIGKNLVAMMLEGGGFEVVDIGIDVPAQKFIDAIRLHQPKLVGLSALLTTTMKEMEATIAAIDAAGLRNQVRVMVGGAPVTEQFARDIHADGYARDAATAVELAKSLLMQSI
jgi:5-methyltetrahydrofolate--homocysteine methyltransferase